MKILTIADLHTWNTRELESIQGLDYNCCCLLGDISEGVLKIIKLLVNKPLFGVLGNHDDPSSLSHCGIDNIDRKCVTINGVKIVGFGGSHRYKNGDYPMLTQKESIIAADVCPCGDILISHDTAYHVMKRFDKAHCGLKGLSGYIANSKPSLNICGHYHVNERRIFKGCEIICVYRCAIVSVPENTVEFVF